MIRRMLKRVATAAKNEIERRRHPGADRTPAALPEPEPAHAPPAPPPPVASEWRSSAYHVKVLAGTECPFCNGAKAVGSYMCKPCIGTKGVRHVA